MTLQPRNCTPGNLFQRMQTYVHRLLCRRVTRSSVSPLRQPHPDAMRVTLQRHELVDRVLGVTSCSIVFGASSLPVSLKLAFPLCPYKALSQGLTCGWGGGRGLFLVSLFLTCFLIEG